MHDTNTKQLFIYFFIFSSVIVTEMKKSDSQKASLSTNCLHRQPRRVTVWTAALHDTWSPQNSETGSATLVISVTVIMHFCGWTQRWIWSSLHLHTAPLHHTLTHSSSSSPCLFSVTRPSHSFRDLWAKSSLQRRLHRLERGAAGSMHRWHTVLMYRRVESDSVNGEEIITHL